MPLFGRHPPPNEFRLVLIGKTGVGKSRVGNTILNKNNVFPCSLDSKSVTPTCTLLSAERFEKKIDLVDTPGIFDTERDLLTTQKEISRCIGMTAPGPHAILFCLPMCRITDQEIDVIEHYTKYFGNDIMKYLVFIFTHLDSWQQSYQDRDQKVPDEHIYIKSLPEKVTSYLEKCKNRYICLNNRAVEKEKDQKVKELMNIVEEMLSNNRNAYYTNKQYEEAEQILQTMMKGNSIRDELRRSTSFFDKLQLNFKLIINEIYLKYIKKGPLPKEKSSSSDKTEKQL